MGYARDEKPTHYYMLEHRVDRNGREYGWRIIGRVSAMYPRRVFFDDWHEDVIEYMREHAESYVDNTEDVRENTADGHRSVLDFTLCAEPAVKWVLEFIPSGMTEETEKDISAGKFV